MLCLVDKTPSVSECFRASARASLRPGVCPKKLLAHYLTNERTEFHQTLADDVAEAKDKTG